MRSARYLAKDPITDPQAAAQHAEALLRQLQGDLRHATLYHADQRVSALVAPQAERTDPFVLQPHMVAARHGLVVFAWPVASPAVPSRDWIWWRSRGRPAANSRLRTAGPM